MKNLIACLIFIAITWGAFAQEPKNGYDTERTLAKAESLMMALNWQPALETFQILLPHLNKQKKPEKIKVRNGIGRCQLKLGKAGDSLEVFMLETKGLAMELLGERHPEYATSLYLLGVLYHNLGNHAAAKPLYKQALAIQKQVLGEMNHDYAATLNRLGRIYAVMGSYKDAMPLFIQTLVIWKEILGDKHPAYASCLNDLGNLYFDMGNYAAAEPIFLQDNAIIKEVQGEGNPDYAASLINLGNLYLNMGNYPAAEPIYKKSIAILKEAMGEDNPSYAVPIGNLGVLYLKMGNYVAAEAFMNQGIAIQKRLLGDRHPDYATYLNNMANLYNYLGNYAAAEPLFNQSMQIRKDILGVHHPDYAMSLNNLGNLYQNMGDFSRSEIMHKQARDARKEALGKDHPKYAGSLFNMGILYTKFGRYNEAEMDLVQAIDIQKKTLGWKHPELATSLRNLGLLYKNMGNYAASESRYQQALAIQKEILGERHPDYAESMADLANLHLAQNQFQLAIPEWVKAKNLILAHQKVNFPSLSDNEKEVFYKTKIRPYFEQFTSTVLQPQTYSGHDSLLPQLYDLHLTSKALLLNESSRWRRTVLASGDKNLLEKFLAWEQATKKYAAYLNEEEDFNPKTADSLERVSREMEKNLSKISERFTNLTERNPKSWTDVQKTLKPGDAAIEVIRFRTLGNYQMFNPVDSIKPHSLHGLTDSVQYAFLVVTPTSKWPELVVFSEGNAMEKALTGYRNYIKMGVTDEKSYQTYWKNLGEYLRKKRIKKVYFSPDGVYYQISLPTLFNPKTGKYLLDEIEVFQVTNTRDLLNEKASESGSQYAILLGSPDFGSGYTPLPGTQKEVETIAQNLKEKGWEPEVHFGKEAGELALSNMKKPRLLHIATHGYFEASESYMPNNRVGNRAASTVIKKTNPLWRSGLILSKNRSQDTLTWGNDGILTAYEAMFLNLSHTELVVLSACETGLGEIQNGEGVYGLQRAFMVAGAKTVIMSFWKVNDTVTQELMVGFYRHWLAGLTKREAFVKTQREIRARYPTPNYWGAFVMVGE